MTSDLQAALEAAYALSKQQSSDEEYDRFVQRREVPRIFDAAAIERILGKINSRHRAQSFDHEALAQELEHACDRFGIWEAGEQGPTKKQRKDDIEKLRRAIERLRKALSPPDKVRANWLAWALCNAAPRPEAAPPDALAPPPDAVVPAVVMTNLSVIEAAAQEALARIDEGPSHMAEPPISAQNDPSSARRRFIGRTLPKIFSRHFKSKPWGVFYRVGSTEPEGPAIDFVLTVLSIAKIYRSNGTPYTAAGIEEIFQAERPRT
jgi:hypothetical protein